MSRLMLACLLVVAVVSLLGVNAAPQFGGSFAQANAQSGSFGGSGFGGPPRPPFQYGPRPRGLGYGRPRPPGFGGQSGFNRPGGVSISISKSVSIGGGGASSAQSSASSVGK